METKELFVYGALWASLVLMFLEADWAISYAKEYPVLFGVPSQYIVIFSDIVCHAGLAFLCWMLSTMVSDSGKEMHTLSQRHIQFSRLFIFFGSPSLNTLWLAAKEHYEILLSMFVGCAVDLDHFIAAGSFSLEGATHLNFRPWGHCVASCLLITVIVWVTTRISTSAPRAGVTLNATQVRVPSFPAGAGTGTGTATRPDTSTDGSFGNNSDTDSCMGSTCAGSIAAFQSSPNSASSHMHSASVLTSASSSAYSNSNSNSNSNQQVRSDVPLSNINHGNSSNNSYSSSFSNSSNNSNSNSRVSSTPSNSRILQNKISAACSMRAAVLVFSAYSSNLLRDSTRRGLWLFSVLIYQNPDNLHETTYNYNEHGQVSDKVPLHANVLGAMKYKAVVTDPLPLWLVLLLYLLLPLLYGYVLRYTAGTGGEYGPLSVRQRGQLKWRSNKVDQREQE
jgi:hypothetical protein